MNEVSSVEPPAGEVERVQSGMSAIAIWSLILGTLAFAFAVTPLFAVSFLFAIPGLILGIVALARRKKPFAVALLGLIISVVGWIISIIVAIAVAVAGGVASTGSLPAFVAPGSTLTYEVTSDAPNAMYVIYTSNSSGGSGQEMVADAPLPFTKKETTRGLGVIGSSAVLMAMADSNATFITCTIKSDNKVIVTKTSSGPSTIVTCQTAN